MRHKLQVFRVALGDIKRHFLPTTDETTMTRAVASPSGLSWSLQRSAEVPDFGSMI